MKNRAVKTKIMGVLNVTPDSYFAPSRRVDPEAAIDRALQLEGQGADLIDIGGESSRPTTSNYGENVKVSEEEEIRRVIPVIKGLQGKIGIPLSIDTTKVRVAELALEAGCTMINDITGFVDPRMQKLALQSGVDICVMHMQGTPQMMQNSPQYTVGALEETLLWLKKQVALLLDLGISQNRIIIDPGIGFGKSMEHNIAILRGIKEYQKLGCRVLVGASRKLFLSKYLEKPADELLAGTLGVSSYLALQGVDFLRVHDVQEHRDALDILGALQPN